MYMYLHQGNGHQSLQGFLQAQSPLTPQAYDGPNLNVTFTCLSVYGAHLSNGCISIFFFSFQVDTLLHLG